MTARTLRRARPVDPVVGSLVVGGLLAGGGLVALVLTWRGVDRLDAVAFQIPYLVSGGLVGLALVATGITLVAVQLSRRSAARRRVALGAVVDGVAALAAALERRPTD